MRKCRWSCSTWLHRIGSIKSRIRCSWLTWKSTRCTSHPWLCRRKTLWLGSHAAWLESLLSCLLIESLNRSWLLACIEPCLCKAAWLLPRRLKSSWRICRVESRSSCTHWITRESRCTLCLHSWLWVALLWLIREQTRRLIKSWLHYILYTNMAISEYFTFVVRNKNEHLTVRSKVSLK